MTNLVGAIGLLSMSLAGLALAIGARKAAAKLAAFAIGLCVVHGFVVHALRVIFFEVGESWPWLGGGAAAAVALTASVVTRKTSQTFRPSLAKPSMRRRARVVVPEHDETPDGGQRSRNGDDLGLFTSEGDDGQS